MKTKAEWNQLFAAGKYEPGSAAKDTVGLRKMNAAVSRKQYPVLFENAATELILTDFKRKPRIKASNGAPMKALDQTEIGAVQKMTQTMSADAIPAPNGKKAQTAFTRKLRQENSEDTPVFRAMAATARAAGDPTTVNPYLPASTNEQND